LTAGERKSDALEKRVELLELKQAGCPEKRALAKIKAKTRIYSGGKFFPAIFLSNFYYI